MGCNCKNKAEQQKPKLNTVMVNSAIEIVEQPPYTMEEVIRVKEFFNSRFKTEQEKEYVIEWNKQYFEPQFQGYCDAPCMSRIKKRADHAFQKILLYEQSKKTSGKTP